MLTGRYTAYPRWRGLLGGVFYLTFHVIGPCLSRLPARGIAWLADAADGALTALDAGPLLHGLVREGVFAGVGSVAVFLPVILALFFFLSLLEDTGYLARVAFVMDRPLRRLGLSGQSAVPLLLGFGAACRGVLAARTLPTRRDRALTIVLTPCMSCSAKAPVYAAFAAAFFPGRSAVVFLALYALGIGTAAGRPPSAERSLRGEAASFVMELPDYRWPDARSVLRRMWVRTKEFLARAFTVILAASVGVGTADVHAHVARGGQCRENLLAVAGQALAPVFAPLGFGDWRAATALMTGLLAKGDGAVHARRAARRRPDSGAAGRVLPRRCREAFWCSRRCTRRRRRSGHAGGPRQPARHAGGSHWLMRGRMVCGGSCLPHCCPAMKKNSRLPVWEVCCFFF